MKKGSFEAPFFQFPYFLIICFVCFLCFFCC